MLNYAPYNFELYLNKCGAISDEKNLSAEEQEKKEQAWIPRENVYQEWTKSTVCKKGKGTSFAFSKQRDGYGWSISLFVRLAVSNKLLFSSFEYGAQSFPAQARDLEEKAADLTPFQEWKKCEG